MSQRFVSAVFVLLATMGFAACSSGDDSVAGDAPEQASAASTRAGAATEGTPTYPDPIILVKPAPDSEICLPFSMDIRFKLNDRLRVNGRHDPTAFDLVLDGRSILRETEFFGSHSNPQTHVALLHGMHVYDVGPHTARVTYSTTEGSNTFEWKFTITGHCSK